MTQSPHSTSRMAQSSQSMSTAIVPSPAARSAAGTTLGAPSDRTPSGALEKIQQSQARYGGRARFGDPVGHLPIAGDHDDRAPLGLVPREPAQHLVRCLAASAEEQSYATRRMQGDRDSALGA